MLFNNNVNLEDLHLHFPKKHNILESNVMEKMLDQMTKQNQSFSTVLTVLMLKYIFLCLWIYKQNKGIMHVYLQRIGS